MSEVWEITMSQEKIERTIYQSVEYHYDQSLGLITHFVTKLADEAVEMTARGVALAAPLPNAISMYNITQHDLAWSWVASFAFSLALEVVVFLLVEIALMQWDGYLTNPVRYRAPFIGMIVTVMVAVAVVMGFVYWLEPHKIMALLPVISLCSFVGIGLKRWHEQNVARGVKPVKSGKQGKIIKPESKPDSENHQNHQNQPDSTIDYDRVVIDYFRDNPLASQRKAANELGISQPKISKTLSALESEGVIHRNGNGVEILHK